LLHQGYCLSILGEYEQAKGKYLTIIKNYENEDVAITAAVLLRYLEEIMAEVQRVKESDESPILKSEKLYKLIAFEEAIEILDKVTTEDKTSTEKVEYLKARCYEESGSKEKSVKIYQNIIQSDHNSEAAKLSNRRILAISVAEDESEKLKKLSMKNNELIEDDSFDELLDTTSRIEEYTERELMEIVEKEAEEATAAPETTEVLAKQIIPEETVKIIDKTPETSKEPEEDSFQKFIEESIQVIEEEIKKSDEKNEILTGEKPTPSPTPMPTPRKIKKTEVPEQEKKPFTRSVRNSDGIVVKIEFYNEDGTITGITHKDETGRTYKVEQYNENGTLSGYFIYEFDENGDPIKVYAYDANGNLVDSE
jgi:hypothetical protein